MFFCLYGSWEPLDSVKILSRGVGTFSTIENLILRTCVSNCFEDFCIAIGFLCGSEYGTKYFDIIEKIQTDQNISETETSKLKHQWSWRHLHFVIQTGHGHRSAGHIDANSDCCELEEIREKTNQCFRVSDFRWWRRVG